MTDFDDVEPERRIERVPLPPPPVPVRPVVPYAGNSQEAVAFALFSLITEGIRSDENADKDDLGTKAWILATYAQCLRTVRRARYVEDDDGTELFRLDPDADADEG